MRAAYTPVAIWHLLRSTYWFIPSLMTVGAVALAVSMVAIDRSTDSGWLLAWLYSGGADGARSLLSAVAGSTITVVSLTFSVTIVALTVTSQHFGPRLLNSFMRDVPAQLVLGAFIGTFSYCLMVLRTVRGEGDGLSPFVPHLAVTVAVAMTLASVAALIYFIHHISASMQVATITTEISRDLEAAIDRLYPAEVGAGLLERPPDQADVLSIQPADAVAIKTTGSGYVQVIEADALMALACEHDLTIWLATRPGEFLVAGVAIAFVAPPSRVSQPLSVALNRLLLLGPDRTSRQDAGFALQQLVEVALHALSPGMNEPFTAITCIDRLGQSLALLAGRARPAPERRDLEGTLRVIAPADTFETFLREAFTPISVFAGRNPAISVRLLRTLGIIAGAASSRADLAGIRVQADVVWRAAGRQIEDASHRALIDQQYHQVLALTAQS